MKPPDSTADLILPYAIGVLCLLGIWGIGHFETWYFASLLGLAVFVVCRKKSRFQVPWLLEIFPMMTIMSYTICTFYFREDRLTGDALGDLEITQALWIAIGASFIFSLSCLGALHGLIPRGSSITIQDCLQPLSRRLILRMYGVGLILNTLVVPLAPSSLRVVFISLGNLEIISMGVLLLQSVHGVPGFGKNDFKWGIAGLLFWTLRSVAYSLFGGTTSILLCLSTLFADRLKGWSVWTGILFVMAFAPLIQGVKKEMRSELQEGKAGQMENVPKVFWRNFQDIVLKADGEAYVNGFGHFLDRIDTTPMFLIIKQNMDARQNFARGSTLMESIFWGFVPRFFYPSKPITGGASTLARDYADMIVLEGTSVGVGPIPEFYINFGEGGVFIGMALMGIFYGLVLYKVFTHSVQPLGFVFGALIYAAVIRPETNLADSFGGVLRLIVVWFVLVRMIARANKRVFEN